MPNPKSFAQKNSRKAESLLCGYGIPYWEFKGISYPLVPATAPARPAELGQSSYPFR